MSRALKLTREKADENARKPENLERAKQEARTRIAALLEVPLKTTRFEDVNVVVRFAGEERTSDPSYLDLSTPYNEAIAEAQRRRAAEGK